MVVVVVVVCVCGGGGLGITRSVTDAEWYSYRWHLSSRLQATSTPFMLTAVRSPPFFILCNLCSTFPNLIYPTRHRYPQKGLDNALEESAADLVRKYERQLDRLPRPRTVAVDL